MTWAGVLAAALAGSTIFLGLPLARWRGASQRLRAVLALVSAGGLLFLVVEVGHHAIEAVEASVQGGFLFVALRRGLLFVVGFTLGLVGLAWLEDWRGCGHRAVEDTPEMATILAVGIGLHNFAIGLAIGQAFAGGADRLGVPLLLGFSLHSVTEGFGIAGVLIGRNVSWARLFGLGLVARLPTALGAGLGGVWVNSEVELLCLSPATGSLVYVARELLQPRLHALSTVAAASAVASGFLLGLAAELVTGMAYM